MDIRIHRCRFCGKEYNYHASGPYCHEATNNEQYCPRCMEIINCSLEVEVPKDDRYIKKIVKVSEAEVVRLIGSDLKEKLNKLKGHNRTGSNPIFPPATMLIPLQHDHIEVYTINRYRIYVCWDGDGKEQCYYADKLCRLSDQEEVEYYYHHTRDSFNTGSNIARCFNGLTAKIDKPISFDDVSKEITKTLQDIEEKFL